jgi:hypothetical protein
MKEASGELNMTIVVIIAVGAVLAFLTIFLPDVFKSIRESWQKDKTEIPTGYYMEMPDRNIEYM